MTICRTAASTATGVRRTTDCTCTVCVAVTAAAVFRAVPQSGTAALMQTSSHPEISYKPSRVPLRVRTNGAPTVRLLGLPDRESRVTVAVHLPMQKRPFVHQNTPDTVHGIATCANLLHNGKQWQLVCATLRLTPASALAPVIEHVDVVR
jgi:hypothetical protein